MPTVGQTSTKFYFNYDYLTLKYGIEINLKALQLSYSHLLAKYRAFCWIIAPDPGKCMRILFVNTCCLPPPPACNIFGKSPALCR